ncbi:alpha/beta hydrolase [Halobacillus sp. B23F22_1]|uniref:alpha/beta hydrolase n=1 Tax=Halobacillus sp. B23F22_1 TaxID=3459514 RepID=UPI00373F99A9
MTGEKRATIIIVHGAFEHAGRYVHLVKKLEQDGFEVKINDLPGQGMSEGKKGHIRSFNDYIKKVSEWVEEADKDLPVFLLGHSMGGLIVTRTLQQLKITVDGVILSSPAFSIKNGASKPMEVLSRGLNIVWPAFKVSSSLAPETVTTNQEMIASDQSDPLIIDKVSVRWYIEFQRSIKKAFKEVKYFPDIPLLIMQAGDDLIVDRRRTYQWFNLVCTSEKFYKEWPGYYHEIFNEVKWQQPYLYLYNFIQQQLIKQ